MLPEGLLEALLREATASGVDLSAWALAWARALPTALLVPAFGLGFLPWSQRAVFGLVLALAVAPSLVVPGATPPAVHVALALAGEAVRGLPVALSAAVIVWAATVTGGVVDLAAGVRSPRGTPAFGAPSPSLAALFGLLSCGVFLDRGGAAVVAALLSSPAPAGALASAAFGLAAGIDAGALVAVPLVAVALAVEVVSAVAAREHAAFASAAVVAPLRTLVVLVAVASVFDRLAEVVLGGS